MRCMCSGTRMRTPVPLMRAGGQPAQHILGADDGQQIGFYGAVDGRNEHKPAGADESGADFEKCRGVGHVFDHLEAEHGVELQPVVRQRLHRAYPVVDREPLFEGVAPRRLDVFQSRVDAGDTRAQARHRLRNEPAAATDIEHGQAVERTQARALALEMRGNPVADKLQARGAKFVQRRELALGVPPLRRDTAEPVDLGGVEGLARGGGCFRHGRIGVGRAAVVNRQTIGASDSPV